MNIWGAIAFVAAFVILIAVSVLKSLQLDRQMERNRALQSRNSWLEARHAKDVDKISELNNRIEALKNHNEQMRDSTIEGLHKKIHELERKIVLERADHAVELDKKNEQYEQLKELAHANWKASTQKVQKAAAKEQA